MVKSLVLKMPSWISPLEHQGDTNSCPLCNSISETVDHLFLHCQWTCNVWRQCMAWWEVRWCANMSFIQWMDGWLGMCPVVKYKKAWSILFFAVIWTIWEARNNLIFRGQEALIDKAVDDVKFRVAWWYKYIGRGNKLPVTIMMLNIRESCVSSDAPKKAKAESWKPPEGNNLKFNVDGSARGQPGPAGIGGILRNSAGSILCQFSLAIGTQNSNTAEILAILKACELCASKPSLLDRKIQIVSDSLEAVRWVNNVEDYGSLQHAKSILDIRSHFHVLKSLSIIYNPRDSNHEADALAKSSSNGGEDSITWSAL